MKWVYLGIAIVSEVIGTSALKQAEGFRRLYPSIIVVVAYAAAFYFLSLTLESIPTGIAYAIWSGIGVVLISLIGMLFFDQHIYLPGWIGIALITAGVVVLNLFSKSSAH